MVISATLLELLVCPETRQQVRLADTDTVAKMNQLIAAGTLQNIRGKAYRDNLSGALVREDGKVAYGIVGDIPVMLVDEGIPLSQLA